MISLVLCLAVLTSLGAATVVPPHNEDVSTNTRQWQDLSGTAQQSVLFKRMDRGHDIFDPFENFGGFFDHQNDIPNAQPSSATASQSHSHGILPDESHNFHETYLPAAWDMSHYQSYAQYPSDFYAQDPSDFYTQSDYWSHNSHIQPHGQDFPETHSSQHLSHDHDSTGSGDEKIKSKRKKKQSSEASERNQSSRSKSKASQDPSDRKVAQPKFPEKVITREQLLVAMTFYRHEQTYRETNNKNDLFLLPEEAAVLSKKMKKLYQRIYRNRNKDKPQGAPKGASFKTDWDIFESLRKKINKIKMGMLLGSTWSLEEEQKLEYIRRRGMNVSLLEHKLRNIKPYIKRCWAQDPKVLDRLDQNPWDWSAIEYINHLLSSPDRSSHAPSAQ